MPQHRLGWGLYVASHKLRPQLGISHRTTTVCPGDAMVLNGVRRDHILRPYARLCNVNNIIDQNYKRLGRTQLAAKLQFSNVREKICGIRELHRQDSLKRMLGSRKMSLP